MPMTNAETIGFNNQLIQLMQDNKTELQTKGLDVTGWITDLTAKKDDAVTKDATEDDIRVSLKTAAGETKVSMKTAYKTASTYLDAIIGVSGKDTQFAKQAAKLWSNIIKQSKKKKDDKPE